MVAKSNHTKWTLTKITNIPSFCSGTAKSHENPALFDGLKRKVVCEFVSQLILLILTCNIHLNQPYPFLHPHRRSNNFSCSNDELAPIHDGSL